MNIDGFTLPHNPSKMTLIKPKKISCHKETWSDVAYFSWATLYAGSIVDSTWPVMDTGTFATLDAMYQGDSTLVVNPQDASGNTYNTKMTYFNGEFHRGLTIAANTKRVNVKMTLLILSKV